MRSSISSSSGLEAGAEGLPARAAPLRRRAGWILLLVCTGLAELGLASLLFQYALPRQSWRRVTSEVLFIGSSHTGDAIDPSHYPMPVAKISFAALDIELAYHAFRRHEALWPKLRWVVVEVDEFTLLTDTLREHRENVSHLSSHLGLASWELPRRQGDGDLGLTWSIEQLVHGNGFPSLQKDRRTTLSTLHRRLFGRDIFSRAAVDPAGIAARPDAIAPLTLERGRDRIAHMEQIERRSAGAVRRNRVALNAFAQRLSGREVGLILISYPEHEVYTSQRPSRWDDWIEQAVAGAARRSDQVRYWNLREHHELRDNHFDNQDHLNAAGARKLADLLGERFRGLDAESGLRSREGLASF